MSMSLFRARTKIQLWTNSTAAPKKDKKLLATKETSFQQYLSALLILMRKLQLRDTQHNVHNVRIYDTCLLRVNINKIKMRALFGCPNTPMRSFMLRRDNTF